jgi:hypothetical protein
LHFYKARHFSDWASAVPQLLCKLVCDWLTENKALIFFDICDANEILDEFFKIYMALANKLHLRVSSHGFVMPRNPNLL